MHLAIIHFPNLGNCFRAGNFGSCAQMTLSHIYILTNPHGYYPHGYYPHGYYPHGYYPHGYLYICSS